MGRGVFGRLVGGRRAVKNWVVVDVKTKQKRREEKRRERGRWVCRKGASRHGRTSWWGEAFSPARWCRDNGAAKCRVCRSSATRFEHASVCLRLPHVQVRARAYLRMCMAPFWAARFDIASVIILTITLARDPASVEFRTARAKGERLIFTFAAIANFKSNRDFYIEIFFWTIWSTGFFNVEKYSQ